MSFPERPRAVITGAGSGLGRALALQLARRGGRILIADIQADGAAETARLVVAAGGQAEAITVDVRHIADLERAATTVEQLWGGVDIVINNAGVAAGGPVGEFPLDDWRWIIDINLWGVIHGCHVFVPRLRRQGTGFILNVASAAGFASLPEMPAYNVTKAAVISLSETLYVELSDHNIGVTVACPSFFKTNLMATFRSPSERQRTMAENLFRRSRMTAEQVARIALAALEAGKLYAIPQSDAKTAWRLKRLSPEFYAATIRKRFRAPFIERTLLKQ